MNKYVLIFLCIGMMNNSLACWETVEKVSNTKSIFILAVGSNLDGLKYANADADNFVSIMEKLFIGSKPYTCTLKYDETTTDVNAFEIALRKLKKKVDTNDLVIIFYSGHGAKQTDFNGDEIDDEDEYFILTNNSFVDDTFVRLVNKINTKNILTVIDSCFAYDFSRNSDSIVHEQIKKVNLQYPIKRQHTEQNLEFNDINGILFAATNDKGERPAYELKGSCGDDRIGGRFTVFWKEVLNEYINHKQHIDLSEVFKEVKKRVYQHSRVGDCQSKEGQDPKARIDNKIMRQINSFIPANYK